MAEDTGTSDVHLTSSRLFSLEEVMAMSNPDLPEYFSLISRNLTARSRVTADYTCRLLGNSCNMMTSGRNAKADMARHIRSHLKDISSKDQRQKTHSQSGLGRWLK